MVTLSLSISVVFLGSLHSVVAEKLKVKYDQKILFFSLQIFSPTKHITNYSIGVDLHCLDFRFIENIELLFYNLIWC